MGAPQGRDGPTVFVCDLGALGVPDAVVVDIIARLQLVARRLGGRLKLVHSSNELKELIEFMGLTNVLPSVVDAEG